MDWWQSIDAGNGVTLDCLPAQHWSRRIGQPVNSTLWASFLLRTPGPSVYYGADSGYFVGYREFGRRFAGIDYALLSTTAYHPRWFMHYAHVNIEEALEAFKEIGARYFIPTQWGTFRLGDEPAGYPALELKAAIAHQGLDANRFLILDIGQIQPLSSGR
jgi:L-ascorbate metabolism protein UlaG (beta-lactamase superfamily)